MPGDIGAPLWTGRLGELGGVVHGAPGVRHLGVGSAASTLQGFGHADERGARLVLTR